MSNFRHGDDPWTRIRSFSVTVLPTAFPKLTPPHPDGWHQLIHAIRGVVHVRTRDAAWITPPHRAVWIPGGIAASIELRGEVALRMLYVRAGRKGLPSNCAVVNVNPLLRELIVRVNRIGALDRRLANHAHLEAVIFDELRSLESASLEIPLPSDPRALKLVDLAGRTSPLGLLSGDGARECGASRRTLERIFREQTALSLGQWVRRYALLRAVGLLSEGQKVSSVAAVLGYQSTSAFIAMFRREFGQTPGCFAS